MRVFLCLLFGAILGFPVGWWVGDHITPSGHSHGVGIVVCAYLGVPLGALTGLVVGLLIRKPKK